MDKPIFYRSIGIIKGLYLPSNENLNNGSLLTEQGLFTLKNFCLIWSMATICTSYYQIGLKFWLARVSEFDQKE